MKLSNLDRAYPIRDDKYSNAVKYSENERNNVTNNAILAFVKEIEYDLNGEKKKFLADNYPYSPEVEEMEMKSLSWNEINESVKRGIVEFAGLLRYEFEAEGE